MTERGCVADQPQRLILRCGGQVAAALRALAEFVSRPDQHDYNLVHKPCFQRGWFFIREAGKSRSATRDRIDHKEKSNFG